MIEDANRQLGTNRAMWMMSVIFGVMSIFLLCMGQFASNWPEIYRAILFGLSIGTGVEGSLSATYSLLTSGNIPGVRFASVIGLGASLVGVGASVYEGFFKG